MSLFHLIGNYVREHWRPYLIAGSMLSIVAVLTVWVPRQVGFIIDGLVAGRLVGPTLVRELAWLAATGVTIYFMRVGWRLYLFKAAFQFGLMLRTRLYRQLCLQGPGFYQQQRTGDLMALATNDIDAIEMAAGEAMLAGFDGSLTLLMVLGMMTLGVDWRLSLGALLPYPFMAFAFWKISAQIHRASQDALARFSDLNGHALESLAGVRMVRALGLEQGNVDQFSVIAGQAADASYDAQRWEAGYEPVVGLALTTSGGMALGLGGYLVWQGELTIGALTSFSMYLGTLIWPMFAAGWVLALIERGRAAWDRLAPVLHAPPSMADHGTQAHITPGELKFDGLRFSYPGQSSPALDGVSFTLQAGQTLGLVGPTGSGKTTLLRLLLRQFAPDAGTLCWGGTNIHALQLASLRDAVSWVPQESFLFSASIAENIALARADATQADIEQVAALAAVHEDILRCPAGYQTAVGERGITLSGGQRQRLAIARALLADRPLLVLDDALSAVDTGTEASILQHMQTLRAERSGRTVIIASHRLSAVADADHIVVLKQGRVIESGRHEALLALGGWYASQWRYQQLEASLDAL
jgi:ATP-binding cassette subfamily B protein/ATP-binding cassette subfamily C protein/ATP-binding cassette subfamily B multidrug efflux pump